MDHDVLGEIERNLEEIAKQLNEVAKQIPESDLASVPNLGRIGEAIASISDIRIEVYQLRPDLEPAYLDKRSKRRE